MRCDGVARLHCPHRRVQTTDSRHASDPAPTSSNIPTGASNTPVSDDQTALTEAGITPSMSRRSNPLDNAPMVSFFHTLKTEMMHHRT